MQEASRAPSEVLVSGEESQPVRARVRVVPERSEDKEPNNSLNFVTIAG
jgi:hypothetical protein